LPPRDSENVTLGEDDINQSLQSFDRPDYSSVKLPDSYDKAESRGETQQEQVLELLDLCVNKTEQRKNM
jgi:hypothetical protein